MVVRIMSLRPISQCNKHLNFIPRRAWSAALPAMAWQGELLCAFERQEGQVLDLFSVNGTGLIDAFKALHPELGLGELARFSGRFEKLWPDLYVELREALFSVYGLKWSARLSEVLGVLAATPLVFQNFVDEKKWGTRDLSPLLILKDPRQFDVVLEALAGISLSKFEAVRALEYVIELYMMGRPLNDLLPSTDNGALWLRRLEQWRRPETSARDEDQRRHVAQMPWPPHVQAQWQRFGDEAGLEIKIRTTSPEDLEKKLERLMTIPETWSCKN